MQSSYRVLLFYQYVEIQNPRETAEWQRSLCERLGLKGRLLIAREGLNGTVCGAVEAIQQYCLETKKDVRFANMDIKEDVTDTLVFDKLRVRVTQEIVNLGLGDTVDPLKKTGKHLSPREFYEMLLNEDVIVIDGRNRYESEIGHFRGAITPDVETFREFPLWIDEHQEMLKGKKILTYCTGGIRCEKLTSYLIDKGFTDVYQLEGGIIRYSQDEEVQGKLYDGKCYVFDNRMAVPINRTEEDVVISACEHCGTAWDIHVNCAYLDCHRRHLSCPSCQEKLQGFCSEACRQHALEENRVDPRVPAARPVLEQTISAAR